MEEPSYSTVDVVELTGATYRQLDYWSRTGTLVAAVEARGSGTQRRYTYRQALIARVLTVLAAHGARGPVLRGVAATLCDWPFFEAQVIVDRDGYLDLYAAGDGWVVDLAAAREYVDTKAGRVLAAS